MITPSKPSFDCLTWPADHSHQHDRSSPDAPDVDQMPLLTLARPQLISPRTPDTTFADRSVTEVAARAAVSPFRRSRCECYRTDIVGELHRQGCYGLTIKIFSFLSARDLQNLRLVSRMWNDALRTDPTTCVRLKQFAQRKKRQARELRLRRQALGQENVLSSRSASMTPVFVARLKDRRPLTPIQMTSPVVDTAMPQPQQIANLDAYPCPVCSSPVRQSTSPCEAKCSHCSRMFCTCCLSEVPSLSVFASTSTPVGAVKRKAMQQGRSAHCPGNRPRLRI